MEDYCHSPFCSCGRSGKTRNLGRLLARLVSWNGRVCSCCRLHHLLLNQQQPVLIGWGEQVDFCIFCAGFVHRFHFPRFRDSCALVVRRCPQMNRSGLHDTNHLPWQEAEQHSFLVCSAVDPRRAWPTVAWPSARTALQVLHLLLNSVAMCRENLQYTSQIKSRRCQEAVWNFSL